MMLCLDVGNTHFYGGLFVDDKIKLTFRYASSAGCTEDMLGLFLVRVLRENGFESQSLKGICSCSVVPAFNDVVDLACEKYFGLLPLRLKPGVKTGVKLQVKNPFEVGGDHVANAVAATEHFPGRDIIIVDFGTATTVCAVSKEKFFLGGAIFPGFKLAIQSLSKNTAKLASVDVVVPESALGKTIEENIQSGVYYYHLGGVKEIIAHYKKELACEMAPIILSTGEYANIFSSEKIFDLDIPDLVLHGLHLIWDMNKK